MKALTAFLLLALLTGCGPTEEEAGMAVLCAAPLALLAGLLLLSFLLRLWRRRYPELALRLLPSLLAVAALTTGAVVKFVFNEKLLEYFPIALWFFGTAYLTILLVTWRVWFALDARRSFTWASISVMMVYVAPAVYFVIKEDGGNSASDWVINFWSWPGYLGWIPGLMLTGFLLEAFHHGRAPKISGES